MLFPVDFHYYVQTSIFLYNSNSSSYSFFISMYVLDDSSHHVAYKASWSQHQNIMTLPISYLRWFSYYHPKQVYLSSTVILIV